MPLEVVPESAAFPAIRAIVKREGIGGIVVGLPLLLDGSEGAAVRLARRLGGRIERALALPVAYEDERFTTVAAEREGGGGKPRDDVAAALMLQQFLDRRKRESDARS